MFLKYKYWTMAESMSVFGVFIIFWINLAVYFAPDDAGFLYMLNTAYVGVAVYIYTLLKMGTDKKVQNERNKQ